MGICRLEHDQWLCDILGSMFLFVFSTVLVAILLLISVFPKWT